MSDQNQFISLAEAAKQSGYTQEYFSLRARQGKLKAIKIGRNWATKNEWLQEYLNTIAKQEYYNASLTKDIEPPADNIEKVLESNLEGNNVSNNNTSFATSGQATTSWSTAIVGTALALAFVLVGFTGFVFGKDFLSNFYSKQAAPLLSEFSRQIDRGVVKIFAGAADVGSDINQEIANGEKNISDSSSSGLFKNFQKAFSRTLFLAKEGAVETGKIFGSFLSKINSLTSSVYLSTAQVAQYTTNNFQDFGKWLLDTFKNIPDAVINLFSRKVKVAEPRPAQEEGVANTPSSTQPSQKEVIKEIVEVQRITQVEPVKEITRQLVTIDDRSLQELQNLKVQFADFKNYTNQQFASRVSGINLPPTVGPTGGSSITTLGTITSGTWQANTIDVPYGGTGLTQVPAGYTLIGNTANALQATSTLFVSPDGKVGIGTITPGTLLTLRRSTAGNVFAIRNTGDTADTFRITDAGIVNLGTWQGSVITTGYGGTGLSTIGTADQLLGVNSGATGLEYKNIASLLTAGTNISISGTANATIATVANPSFSTSVTTPLLTNAGALTLRTTATAGADDLIFNTVGTERMRILENGNVGIGTITPSTKLEVAGNMVIRNPGTTATFDIFSTANVGVKLQTTNDSSKIGSISGQTGTVLNWFWDSSVARFVTPKVAIGGATEVSNPANKLDVYGAVAVGTGYFGTNAPSNGMIIQGNVGIGTTAPGNILHVRANDATASGITNLLRLTHDTTGTPGAGLGSGIIFAGETSTTENSDMAQIDAIWTTIADASRASALRFHTLTGGGALTERMRIDATGNVGIGTPAPSVPLHIVKSSVSDTVEIARFEGSGSVIVPYFALRNANNYETLFGMRDFGAGFFQHDTNQSFRIEERGGYLGRLKSGRALIEDTGSLGETENYLLKLSGNRSFDALDPIGLDVSLDNSDSMVMRTQKAINISSHFTDGLANYGIYMDNIWGADENYGIYIGNTPGALNYSLYSNNSAPSYFGGNVGIGTTAPAYLLDVWGTIRQRNALNCSLSADTAGVIYCTPSSLKYKEVLGEMNLDTDKFFSITTKMFRWKEDELQKIGISLSGESIGFIAQEVDKIMPELVRYNTDGEPIGIKTDLLPFYLFEALKKQQGQIEDIKLVLNSWGMIDNEEEGGVPGGFMEKLKEILAKFGVWIEDGVAKIKELFAEKVRTKELCLEGNDGETICVTKDELKRLLNNSGAVNSGVSSGSGSSGTSNVEPNSEPEPSVIERTPVQTDQSSPDNSSQAPSISEPPSLPTTSESTTSENNVQSSSSENTPQDISASAGSSGSPPSTSRGEGQ